MNIDVKNIGKGKTLGVISTEKFKFNYFSLNFLLPKTEENIANAVILARVLARGSEKYPDIKSINKKLGMLYGANVGSSVSDHGDKISLKINSSFLDEDFLPKGEKMDILGEVTELVYQLLSNPLVKDGAFCKEYVEQEKKFQCDKIKAQINNKDLYAMKRFASVVFEGTPMRFDMDGTLDSIGAVTAKSAYALLLDVLKNSRLEAVFAGRVTKAGEEKMISFINALCADRESPMELSVPEINVKKYDEARQVYEEVSAKQGRMVLSYTIPGYNPEKSAVEVFNHMFGASPISRLFVNVRERLQLCYYCMSSASTATRLMTVRSGLDIEKRDTAIEEIERQLGLLTDAANISEEELEAAKLDICASFTSLEDNISQLAEWYITRTMYCRHTDLEKCKRTVNAVKAEDIAEAARGCKLNVSYFLHGTDK